MSTEAINRQRADAVSKEDRNERAMRAVKVFRSMQHGLTSYARAITGNPKVRVQIGSGVPHTDGTTIYYRPPIRLGDNLKHDRSLCDKRNDLGLLECEACAVREEVLVNIYHEIAHIAFDTFAETTDKDRRDAVELAINEWGTSYADRIKKAIDSAPQHLTRSYLGLARLISPYLPYLVNCLEDARVDSSMFRARKGIRKMLMADTYSLIRDGIPNDDGEPTHWSDSDLNSQASLACYLAGAGYVGWEQYLHPKVGQDFGDEKIQDLMKQLRKSETASDTYGLAFPILARLRELGYFHMPEEEPETPPQEEEQEDESSEPEDAQQADARDDSKAEEGDGGREEGSGDGEQEVDDSTEAGADSASGDGQDADLDSESEDSGDSGVPEDGGDTGASGDSETGVAEGDSQQGESDSKESEGVGDADSDGVPEDPAGQGANESGIEESEGDNGAESEAQPDVQSSESSSIGGGSESEELLGDEDGVDSGDDIGGQGSPGVGEVESDSSELDTELEDSEHASGAGASEIEGDEAQGSGDPGPLLGGFDYSAEGDGDGDESTEESTKSEVSGPDFGQPDEDAGQQEGPAEAIDTGADEGLGGIEVYGSPEEVEENVGSFHNEVLEKSGSPEETSEDFDAVNAAVIQGMYFETPSANVSDVNEYTLNSEGVHCLNVWREIRERDRIELGIDCDMDISEGVMGPNLLRLRRVFSDNKNTEMERNRRSGKVNQRVLGKRAWSGDDRLFQKKRVPGKRDYAVLIGIDISSSTLGVNLSLAKRAAMAQAELCYRLGIKFAVYAHCCDITRIDRDRSFSMEIYHIKDFDQPWNTEARKSLSVIAGSGGNLDGHTMEYYRKQLDTVEATDKVLLYYTDGKMPAANHDEELEILQREIRTCKRKNYTLMGVGIRTDSPVRHGLDTVEVHDDEDLAAVVNHLGKRLARSGR